MFKDFPSLHPFAVHFPIVLILLAAAFQGVLVWKDWKQIRWTTLLIMAAAFFSALAASTVFHAEPAADVPKTSLEMFEQHEKYAQLTLWMSGITFLLKGIGVFFKINRRPYELIVLTAAIIAAVFLSIAGHHGARLTHIAGVGPMGRFLMKEHGKESGMKDMGNMTGKSDSSMKMNSEMKDEDSMQGMDNSKDGKGMKEMKGMKGMKDMNDKKDMKDMKGMKDMKNMKGMKVMKDMKDMKGMKDMNDKKEMKEMKDMKNMPGMDSTMKMGNMKNMKMPSKNAMDTFRFPDNTPGRKKHQKM